MNARAKLYVFSVVVLAGACSSVLYWYDAPIPFERLGAVVVLSSLALIAEILGLLVPNSLTGSIAFIPYLAAALVVPNWIALVGVATIRIVLEVASRRPVLAGVFNTAQQVVTFSSAVLLYRLVGGVSLYSYTNLSLAQITFQAGLPALLAFVLSFAVNSSLVFGYLASKSERTFGELWRESYLATLSIDALASPIVFLFAWVYVEWGAFAATALWVPVLGLRQLHKNVLDLERTNSELLELMVKSMEARDPYTSGHSRRVQQYSVIIARALELSPAEIENTNRAALLHDVGKIYEKYAPILKKPGKLSPEEWQTMQEHPGDGAALVSTMSKLRDIIPAIRHHHERWDGTGYPDGLVGETIPKVSRIIAFADTIDAMTSERPYRGTLSDQEVRAEILRCRGRQFDPRMTDRILSSSVWRHIFTPAVVEPAKGNLTLLPMTRRGASRAG